MQKSYRICSSKVSNDLEVVSARLAYIRLHNIQHFYFLFAAKTQRLAILFAGASTFDLILEKMYVGCYRLVYE